MKLSSLLSTLRAPGGDIRANTPMLYGDENINDSLGAQRKRTMSMDGLTRDTAPMIASTTEPLHLPEASSNEKILHRRKSSTCLNTVAHGMRRFLSRASLSLRTTSSSLNTNTSSNVPTSFARLRRASFNSAQDGWPSHSSSRHYHSSSVPFLATVIDDENIISAMNFNAPIPGNGSDPPIVPDGSSGAAARAAAAAENERFKRLVVVGNDSTTDKDAESGIGIELQDEDFGVEKHEDILVVRKDPIEHFPSELTAYIFAHLDHRSLINCELVSRAWHQAAASQHVWRDVFRNEHRGDLPRHLTSSELFSNSGKGLGKVIPDQDWKKMFSLRKDLRRRWARGNVLGCYLSGHTDSVYCVQFDDDKIITGSRDQTIRVWDIRTGDCIRIIGPPPLSELSDAVASNSQSSTSASGVITIEPSSEVSNTSRPQTSTANSTTSVRLASSEYHRASILCLQYDSEILVTGSSDTTCIVWSIMDNYTPIRRLSQHSAGVLDISFDSKRIVSCSKDTTLCVWDRTTGALLHQLKGHKGPVNAVQVRGNLAASGSGDSLVKLWNLESAVCIREFDGHDRGLACVQFSEDAQMIVSGGNDDVIRIWNANTGECIRKLSGHKHLIRALHLDSDNGRLVSASYDKSIKVYDIHTGRLMLDFPGWHASWILSAKADYRRIVSTSQDRRMLILDFGAELKDVELLEG